MKLLCIDPGGSGKGTTGVVVLHVTDNELPELTNHYGVSGGLEGLLKKGLRWWIESADHVVVERFINRNVKGADLTPVLIEGAVLALCMLENTEYTRQSASGKNTAVSDDVLKRIGMYSFPGDNHHDRREAARHGLMYLRNNYHVPTLKLITG